jgi:hypothetical protein
LNRSWFFEEKKKYSTHAIVINLGIRHYFNPIRI